MKKGKISKKEFWKRVRVRAAGTLGGVAGGTGGAIGGFALGTLIFPGIGSAVGAVIGGVAGGLTGDFLISTVYGKMDQEVVTMRKEQRVKEYKLALEHMGFDDSVEDEEIEDYFFVKHKALSEHNEELREKFELLRPKSGAKSKVGSEN